MPLRGFSNPHVETRRDKNLQAIRTHILILIASSKNVKLAFSSVSSRTGVHRIVEADAAVYVSGHVLFVRRDANAACSSAAPSYDR
jgi:hypothetical protein